MLFSWLWCFRGHVSLEQRGPSKRHRFEGMDLECHRRVATSRLAGESHKELGPGVGRLKRFCLVKSNQVKLETPIFFSPKNHRSGAGIYWIEGNFCVFFWGGLGGEKANFHFNDSGTKCGVMVRRNNNMVDGSDAGSRSSKVHEKKASNTFMFTRKK